MADEVGDAEVVAKPEGKVREEEGCRALTKLEKRLLAPAGCRAYMRRSLAKEFPGIVDGFVKVAKSGSVRHLKLVTELLQPTRQGAARVKGPSARFFEQLEREKKERARAKPER